MSYKIGNGAWVDLSPKLIENPSLIWEAVFSPDAKADLGDYDFRVKFTDQSEAESNWLEKNRLVTVNNSLPVIDQSADNFHVTEDNIKEFDLSTFGSDYESEKNVIWSLNPDSVNTKIFNATILRNKILEIRPLDNMNGQDDITLILTDTDGGKREKTDVTIVIDPENDAPSAPTSVKITPDSPTTLDSLVCSASGSIDLDNDKVVYRYQWYKNNVIQPDLKSADVHNSLTKKGEIWRCEVTPSDGKVDGILKFSEVKIGNVAPKLNTIKTDGNTKDVIISYELEDPDNDLCDIKLEYKAKGSSWKSATTSESLQGIAPNKGLNITWKSSIDLPDIEADDCKLRIIANDKVLPSDAKESEIFILDNKPPKFNVVAVSNPVHRAYIDISISSHEELSDKTPNVSVKINEQDYKIDMNKVGDKIWTGNIKLDNGFDGNILVTVNGTDVYGNSGKEEIQREFKIPAPEPIPTRFALGQNYPNPVINDTRIPYELTESAIVTVRIYNINGELIRTIEEGYKSAGYYNTKERSAFWDGKDDFGLSAASGVYFYHLRAGSSEEVKKMVVQR